jgi:hypothetical protein
MRDVSASPAPSISGEPSASKKVKANEQTYARPYGTGYFAELHRRQQKKRKEGRSCADEKGCGDPTPLRCKSNGGPGDTKRDICEGNEVPDGPTTLIRRHRPGCKNAHGREDERESKPSQDRSKCCGPRRRSQPQQRLSGELKGQRTDRDSCRAKSIRQPRHNKAHKNTGGAEAEQRHPRMRPSTCTAVKRQKSRHHREGHCRQRKHQPGTQDQAEDAMKRRTLAASSGRRRKTYNYSKCQNRRKARDEPAPQEAVASLSGKTERSTKTEGGVDCDPRPGHDPARPFRPEAHNA